MASSPKTSWQKAIINQQYTIVPNTQLSTMKMNLATRHTTPCAHSTLKWNWQGGDVGHQTRPGPNLIFPYIFPSLLLTHHKLRDIIVQFSIL